MFALLSLCTDILVLKGTVCLPPRAYLSALVDGCLLVDTDKAFPCAEAAYSIADYLFLCLLLHVHIMGCACWALH